ncbi:MAG: DUF559 domain-containing protein, partial [Clostridia bacterium]|nr:DUF559 domain-containing protein [Clostridia bacterium]
DSAFWHGKDFETMLKPKTNAEFWDTKIRRNMKRDEEVNRKLSELGWTVLRFWDKDIKKNTMQCVNTIISAINSEKERERKREYNGQKPI